MLTQEMLASSPVTGSRLDIEKLGDCIDACLTCAQTCTSCADSCVNEEGDLRMCISATLTCADICTATASVLSRPTVPSLTVIRAVLTTCMLACRTAAQECERHDHEHCRLCATACREGERQCLEMARAIHL